MWSAGRDDGSVISDILQRTNPIDSLWILQPLRFGPVPLPKASKNSDISSSKLQLT